MTGGKRPLDGDSIESLTASISHLSQQIEVLRNVLDEIREDFSWAVRNNGVSLQPRSFVLKRMALDPTAADWGERLEIVRSEPTTISATRPDIGVDDLARTVDRLAGQANAVCLELEHVRDQFLESLADNGTHSLDTHEFATPSSAQPGEPPQQQSLF